MKRFPSNINLFVICCLSAGLLLIGYLSAFSCEVSWILEARGALPVSAYVLSTQYFLVFVAIAILLHGLVARLPWPLFVWSAVIGFFFIPELVFVMIMTTQHWGLQSTHGLTELISYLIRLIINCLALICVIPTGLRWRREVQVLTQLQDLATRLQMQVPPTNLPRSTDNSTRASIRLESQQPHEGFANGDFHLAKAHLDKMNYLQKHFSKSMAYICENEYNDNMTRGQNVDQLKNLFINSKNGNNKSQSLQDLRCTSPSLQNSNYALEPYNQDENDGKCLNNLKDSKSINHDHQIFQTSSIELTSNNLNCYNGYKRTIPNINSKSYMMEAKNYQRRKCLSLECLDNINKIQNQLISNSVTPHPSFLYPMAYINPYHQYLPISTEMLRSSRMSSNEEKFLLSYYNLHHFPPIRYFAGIDYMNNTNPYIMADSKLSLDNESDDYRRYRDVAL